MTLGQTKNDADVCNRALIKRSNVELWQRLSGYLLRGYGWFIG